MPNANESDSSVCLMSTYLYSTPETVRSARLSSYCTSLPYHIETIAISFLTVASWKAYLPVFHAT